MASSVKISKSKNLSFKKLSFLYLVFILFLFFSSPGEYVYQYHGMAVTQAELNGRLTAELKRLVISDPKELELKKVTLEACKEINELHASYINFAREYGIQGDKLREKNFVENMIRNGNLALKINTFVARYVNCYSHLTKKKALYTEIIHPADFNNKEYQNIDFYFKDTPNGVVESIFEHYKTMFLYQTLLLLNKESKPVRKVEILTLKDSDFIKKFKKTLILGEDLDVMIHSDDTALFPTVKINGSVINISTVYKGKSHLKYTPAQSGNYAVDIKLGSKRVLTSFRVEAPFFQATTGEANVEGEVGKPIILPLGNYHIPANNNSLNFTSNAAVITRTRNVLSIIPKREGRFDVEMKQGEKVLDRLSVFATTPDNPKVGLMDITGQPVAFQNAHRLESINTFWQVINFDMVLIEPDGSQNQFHCATRFLRNELREAQANAPEGSTMIFNNIKLIGRDGTITALASPLVILK